jgi:anaerobic glycerol-3-phosphate dehydrogenase
MGDIRFVKINGRYIPPKMIVSPDMNVLGLVRTCTRLVGRDNSVGVAACFGLDGPGFRILLRARFSARVPDRSWGPPEL